jgi:hypothetical protein
MNLGEVKDAVREHFGRTGFNTPMLEQALAKGRRMVEQEGNFWWMHDEHDFDLVIDQGSYSITTTSSNGLGLSNYKALEFLSWREDGSTGAYNLLSTGEAEKAVLDTLYDTDDEGEPEDAAIQGTTLYIYPENPDDEYEMRMYYYQWTSNPTLNSDTDSLLTQFPDALIHAAKIVGYEDILKDFEGAKYWRHQLNEQIVLIKRENMERIWQATLTFEPRTGPVRGKDWKTTQTPTYR